MHSPDNLYSLIHVYVHIQSLPAKDKSPAKLLILSFISHAMGRLVSFAYKMLIVNVDQPTQPWLLAFLFREPAHI